MPSSSRYFPKIKTLEYLANAEDKKYSYEEVPTTVIVNDEDTINKTINMLYPLAEKFGIKKEINPEVKNEVAVLSPVYTYNDVATWTGNGIKESSEPGKERTTFEYEKSGKVTLELAKKEERPVDKSNYFNETTEEPVEKYNLEDDGTEPVKPGEGTEPVKPGGGTNPVKPGGGTTPVKPGGGTTPVKPGTGSSSGRRSSSGSGSSSISSEAVTSSGNSAIEQLDKVDRHNPIEVAKAVAKVFEKVTKSRVSGSDRVKTSIEISKKHFKKADKVIIVRKDMYPDSLSATALAGKYNCPVILTDKNTLSEGIKEEINRLGAKEILIAGGENSVSDGIFRELAKVGKVSRITGKDRYETSVNIAKEMTKGKKADKLIIASGESFPDALSISSYAAKNNIPVLLSKKNSIPASVKKFIEENKPSEIIIVGGESTLADSVYQKLGIKINRIAGNNRYETSRKIAETFYKDAEKAYISSGEVFADALSVGGAAGKQNAPVILSEKKISVELAKYIGKSKIKDVTLVGGENSISDIGK